MIALLTTLTHWGDPVESCTGAQCDSATTHFNLVEADRPAWGNPEALFYLTLSINKQISS